MHNYRILHKRGSLCTNEVVNRPHQLLTYIKIDLVVLPGPTGLTRSGAALHTSLFVLCCRSKASNFSECLAFNQFVN